MKPLKLTMQAFGPYANKQEIDFTKLQEKTMFVVSGATGAGKTTIFDGISFAIYGRASGDDRSGSDLRSQFAGDETITEVSLLFELRGKRYFIIRSPQQEKKKTRGEGTTTQNAKAELYEIGNEQILLAANVREVDEKMDEIIKIDCHQFRQIMMIPQGEFRKLLISDSKDKEKILQKLFHTELYKQIEEKLKDKASQLRKLVEQSLVKRKTLLGRIQSDENPRLMELINSDNLNITELLEELARHVDKQNQLLQEQETIIFSKEDTRQSIQNEIHQGNLLVEQLQTKDKLLVQKQQLELQKPTIEKQIETIQLANKAMILDQQEKQVVELERQIITKQQELNNAESLIETLLTKRVEKEQTVNREQSKSDQREALQKEINRLQNLEQDVLSFASVEEEVEKLKSLMDRLHQQKANLEYRNRLIEEELSALINEKELIQEAKLKQADLKLTLATEQSTLCKVQDLLKNKNLVIEMEKQFSQAEDERQDFVDELEEKRKELDLIQASWNKAQAGILAMQLDHDHPCPVCGSNHHPNKATLHDDMPTEQQMKAIQEEVKQLEIKKQKLDVIYYDSKSKFEAQMDRVISLADEVNALLPYQLRSSFALEELEEHYQIQCQQLTRESKEVEQTIAKATKVEAAIQTITDNKNQQSEIFSKCLEEIEQNQTTFIEKRRDLARISETLPETLRNEKAFRKQLLEEENRLKGMIQALQVAEKEMAEINQQIASVEGRVSSLQKVVSELMENQHEFQASFTEKLQQVGFRSIEHYNEAKLPEFEVKEMEANVQAFREEIRSVTDRHEELNLRLAGVEKPDLEQLQTKLVIVNQEIKELQDHKNAIYHKVKTNNGVIVSIKEINKEIGIVEEEFKTVGELSDIASGRNTYRITFERFVLASFLDQILLAANGRLTKMTNGRYQLQRKTDRSKGNVQSGLELLVFDHYTGHSRHVKTLSGGESFKASLSLALGLADIVQSYAGGVSMETMFIDEGFGTLDPESLENAIETLMDIQSTGRLVGVISHVPELKERIDARFEVIASQAGSTVTYYSDTLSI